MILADQFPISNWERIIEILVANGLAQTNVRLAPPSGVTFTCFADHATSWKSARRYLKDTPQIEPRWTEDKLILDMQ